jgi:hypothetical protein
VLGARLRVAVVIGGSMVKLPRSASFSMGWRSVGLEPYIFVAGGESHLLPSFFLGAGAGAGFCFMAMEGASLQNLLGH